MQTRHIEQKQRQLLEACSDAVDALRDAFSSQEDDRSQECLELLDDLDMSLNRARRQASDSRRRSRWVA